MDLDVEYDNRMRVPEHPAIIESWCRRSAELRAAAVAADLGVPYGPGARQILDVVWPDASRSAPMVMFLHGGYWQAQHPRDVTFAAGGCLEHGVAMAFVGYDLAPAATLSTILFQVRSAAVCLSQLIGRRVVASGHSAGGHLAAALTATSWRDLAGAGADDLVPSGLGLSGVYDVEPLVSTRLNTALKLDAAEARRLSPSAWPVSGDRAFEAVVGGAESSEFLRQSRHLVELWTAQGATARYLEVPGANHFSILDTLADPASAVVQRLVALARRTTA